MKSIAISKKVGFYVNVATHYPMALLLALKGILNTGFANRSSPLMSLFIKQSSHSDMEK